MAFIIIRAISWENERRRLFSDFCANFHCIRKEMDSSSSLSMFFVKVKSHDDGNGMAGKN